MFYLLRESWVHRLYFQVFHSPKIKKKIYSALIPLWLADF